MSTQKTFIVTGGNTGIGYQICKSLLQNPLHRVIVASRNTERVNNAVKQLKAETSNENVEGLVVDLASLASIHHFCKTIISRGIPIDGLVCNAVVWTNKLEYTQDGFEANFGVNHLGHFLLVRLLLPTLLESSARLVVFTSSVIDSDAKGAKGFVPLPDFEHPQQLAFKKGEGFPPKDFKAMKAYANSKLCNALFVQQLVKRLQGKALQDQLLVYAYDPGFVGDSGPLSDKPRWVPKLIETFIKIRSWFYQIPTLINTAPQAGAYCAMLLSDGSSRAPNGSYFSVDQQREPPSNARNAVLAQELWELSEKLCSLPAF